MKSEVDPKALAEWAAAYHARLLASALALCGDRVEAEELVQETLAEAVGSLARFEGRSAPYTWLYGILRRRFLLHCRRRRRFLRWASTAVRYSSECAAAPMVESGGDPRLASLRVALGGIPVKHREVLHLRYVEGRKIAEIAALISASEGTVKSRLHHALRRVKSAIVREADVPLVPDGEKTHEL
ncbi:MAG: sigma-70 family RNA polymerase sigma factor [Candidatus Aminicenantes bacterium]|nr:sigma-70 family RNA polymerase sigma factor [Candidatus Aminicenantes bacterium]